MKYAIAVTIHSLQTQKLSIKLDIIESDNIESALGKFMLNRNPEDGLIGAYKIKLIEENRR